MSYEIYAGQKNFHLTWNYNQRIIFPILGEEGLKQFNGKTCLEAAEGIATIVDHLNRKLSYAHTQNMLKRGAFGEGGVSEFHKTFGDGDYGHVTEGILRLTEIMIACYRQPDEIFEIH